MLLSFLSMCLCNGNIVCLSPIIGFVLCITPVAETMVSPVNTVLRLLILLSHALISDLVGLIAKLLAHAGVFAEHMVLVGVDSLLVLPFALVVQTPLILFLLSLVLLVPLHHSLVLFSARFDLVCKLRVLLSNLDLFLQPLLLVVQLAQPIFEHLSLDLLLFELKL